MKMYTRNIMYVFVDGSKKHFIRKRLKKISNLEKRAGERERERDVQLLNLFQ